MTTAEHLKSIDFDQDELERKIAGLNGKLDRIFVAVATAAVALLGNLIIRLLESQIPISDPSITGMLLNLKDVIA